MASISEIPLGAGMTAEQARVIFRAGEEAVIFALLEQAKMLARQQAGAATPATPSGMTPGYAKTPAKARSKAPGREKVHPGSPSGSTAARSIGWSVVPTAAAS